MRFWNTSRFEPKTLTSEDRPSNHRITKTLVDYGLLVRENVCVSPWCNVAGSRLPVIDKLGDVSVKIST